MADGWQVGLAKELRAWLDPIVGAAGDPDRLLDLFASAGWYIDQLPAGDQTSLGNVVADLATHCEALFELLANPPSKLEDFIAQVGVQLVPIVADIAKLRTVLLAGLPADAPDLPGDLLNSFSISWLRRRHRASFSALSLLGVIRQLPTTTEDTAGVVYRIKGGSPRLVLEALVALLTNPADAIKTTYWPNGFADNGLGALVLAIKALDLLAALGLLQSAYEVVSGESFDPDVPPPPPATSAKLARQFVLGDGTTAEVGVQFDLVPETAGGLGVVATPYGTVDFDVTTGPIHTTLKGTLAGNAIKIVPAGVSQQDSGLSVFAATLTFGIGSQASPVLHLGDSGGLELTLEEVDLSGAVALPSGKPRIVLAINLKSFSYSLNTDGSDGFLQTILPADGISGRTSFALEWSSDGGVAIRGGGGLSIQLPAHISLGPVEIDSIVLSATPQGKSLPVAISASIAASLGPLAAVVDGIGIAATITLPDEGGNLGPIDVSLGFKPPKGVGLSIDGAVVKGGGYLYIDTDRGEYAGALELVVADFLQLTAIGLISTKMPDGSKGFSLLIIITAEFGTGIQLGFGFTLIGVGGLLGLNRTMLFQPLMDGVRTGAINGILFPTDVIANAPKIISDLKAIFPPKKDTFLIGPMAKLGWGTPTLVSLSLGVVIEIPPGDIAILGVLKLALPTEDDVVLLLQVNFVGALEFDKKRLYFFASMFDSHILFITMQGEMGVLFAYGDDANFVLSVGGFHAQFNPPPLPFPTPKRVQLDIINESYARIRCDGYFAITSNTAQFGSHSEYFFGFSAVSVTGHSGFDALFQFSPFHFAVSISTSFSANVFGIGVFSLDIELTLEGPRPWHAHGTASISFFLFSVGIGIDFTWGDSQTTPLPPIAVMPLLTAEFQKTANWRAVLPANSNVLVSLRKLDPSETALVLHPVGTLQISQRAVPLDLTLDKVGNQTPSDAKRFKLEVASSGLTKTGSLQEPFAPAQFINYPNDATKLSQPAYVPQDSGIELAGQGSLYASGTAITRIVRYDLTIIDTKYRRKLQRFFAFVGTLFVHFLGGNSAARSALSSVSRNQLQPYAEKIAVSSETFAVANLADNRAFGATSVGLLSQASAVDYLNRAVAANPSLTGTLHVLGQHEVMP